MKKRYRFATKPHPPITIRKRGSRRINGEGVFQFSISGASTMFDRGGTREAFASIHSIRLARSNLIFSTTTLRIIVMEGAEVGDEGKRREKGEKAKGKATGCRLMDFPLGGLAAVADSAVKLRRDPSLRRTTRRCRDPSPFIPTYLHRSLPVKFPI